MPYIANLEIVKMMADQAHYREGVGWLGVWVGTGQCVALVWQYAQTPSTDGWMRGAKVRASHGIPGSGRQGAQLAALSMNEQKGALITPGTAIATFNSEGKYANALDGSSHAAIFAGGSLTGEGIWVYDQWIAGLNPQPVRLRLLPFNGGRGLACNDGDQFYVIEPAQ